MTLYVDPDDVMVELRLDPADATPLQERIVARRIEGSQSKVLLFLARASFDPTPVVVREQWLDPAKDPSKDDAWPYLPPFEDRAYYVSHVPATSGDPELYDVTFNVGFDVKNDPELAPVRDFIVIDAAESLFGDPVFPTAPQRVTSVSAGGQSLSFEKRPAGPDAAGGQLSIGTLARFKRLSVSSVPPVSQTPWPYYGSRR